MIHPNPTRKRETFTPTSPNRKSHEPSQPDALARDLRPYHPIPTVRHRAMDRLPGPSLTCRVGITAWSHCR